MSSRTLSDEMLAELTALSAMPDDEIDTISIPEAPAENWAAMRRPRQEAARKPLTVEVDATVAAWLRTSDDHAVQTRVNRILRSHMLRRMRQQKHQEATAG